MADRGAAADADVLVLCGGLGRRLRGVVADRPKPLADVGGRPFLDVLIDRTASFGFRRFVLCAGYMGDLVERRYAGDSRASGLEILVSREPAPLGTAGAVRHALPLLRSRAALILNGDSLCEADLLAFRRFHASHPDDVSVVLAPPEEGAEYGAVAATPEGRISSFAEKSEAGRGRSINAGIYLAARPLLDAIPAGRPSSIERDFLPGLAAEGRAWGWTTASRVLDIGTPERYALARRRLGAGARRAEETR